MKNASVSPIIRLLNFLKYTDDNINYEIEMIIPQKSQTSVSCLAYFDTV